MTLHFEAKIFHSLLQVCLQLKMRIMFSLMVPYHKTVALLLGACLFIDLVPAQPADRVT